MALAETQAVIYKIKPQKLMSYARFRAEAMILPSHEADSKVNKTDWEKIEWLTIKSWQALFDAVA